MLFRRIITSLIVCCAGVSLAAAPVLSRVMAQAGDATQAIITAPTTGEQLFGQVTISGTASHPSLFASYTLEYDSLSDPAVQWLLVQPRVSQQVQNDVLGVWNTNVIPDGVYQLRLRVALTDGQSAETVVSNLRVVNSAPTPIPTSAAPLGDDALPTPGPSPTSLIQQPPSNNPDDDAITGLDTPVPAAAVTTSGSSDPERRINLSRIWRAFCSGVYLTLAAFAVMLVYVVVRARLRPYTQRLVWQIQDEFDKDQ